MKKNLLKLFALFMMSVFSSSVMAQTETNPADATKDIDMVATSYTIGGTYIAGKGGAMAGTMTEKGIKFRINKAYGDTKNALPFVVNAGYKITAISVDGHVNDNSKTSTISTVYVDGTAAEFTPVTLPNKSGSAQFSITNINATKDVVFVFDGAASQANLQYTVTYANLITTDNADLSSIMINGVELEGFNAQTETFLVQLPYGTTTVPTVTATTASPNATVVITPATSLDQLTQIIVTAEDGVHVKSYYIQFSVATVLSNDATLADLTVAGKAINGFRADSLNYAVEIAYKDEVTVSATPNFSEAKAVVTLPETLPGKATVVVTAQDGTTTQTYTIDITRRVPQLYQAIFDNGFDAFITDTNTVEVYYAGTKPAFVKASGLEGEGAVATFNNDVITLGGANGNVEYAVNYHEINPLTTEGTVVFDSTETYIASVYGYTADKGWRFAKSVEEAANRRISSGKNRVQFFFGPAYKVDFTWAVERAIKVYVNGVETTTTAITNGFSVRLSNTQNNLVTIVSDQTKGDGGVSGLTLTTTAPAPELKVIGGQTGSYEGWEYTYFDLGTIEEGQTASKTIEFEATNIPAKYTYYNEENEMVEADNFIAFAPSFDAYYLFDITVSENASVTEDYFGGKQYTFPLDANGNVKGSITVSLKKDLGGLTIEDLEVEYGEAYASTGWGLMDGSSQIITEFNVNFTLTEPNQGGDGTALENATIEAKAVKVIENGVVYIIKNGVKYTVTGVAVK
ncbi:MAG: hypothetical protein J6U94_03610 [Paludibacteraceae bacterium]|nr:hypothetical protein [Paludibacteraceae bacterium]